MAFGSPPGSSTGKPCSTAVSEPGQGTRPSPPLIPAAGYSLAYSILLLVFSNVLLYLLTNAFSGTAPFFSAEPLPADKKLIPLYFFASLATGYREELFFRSYLLPLLSKTIPLFRCRFFVSLFAA
jgi:membrane protease YdiL (CAAX protease family)